jgi:phosphoadenosine phosphosulfate reductase
MQLDLRHAPDRLPDLTTLNQRFADDPDGAIRFSLSGALGRVALVSSFGAESAVLLHLAAQVDRHVPVIFIDTLMLFPETLAYQEALARRLGLTDIRRVEPDRAALFLNDPDAVLHRSDANLCCGLRKTRVLETALSGLDGWISGRKRFQGGSRAELETFERDPASGRIKINPLAGCNAADLHAYMDRDDLPRHPLVARGYPSIGCAPCTTPVAAGEDPRAGRWRGRGKTECGIHLDGERGIRRRAAT